MRDTFRFRETFAVRVRYGGADVGRVSVEVDGAWTSVRCGTSGLDGNQLQASCGWAIEAPRRLLGAEPPRPAPGPTDVDDTFRRIRRLSQRKVDAAQAVAPPVERADAGVVVAFPGVRLDRGGGPLKGGADIPSPKDGGDA